MLLRDLVHGITTPPPAAAGAQPIRAVVRDSRQVAPGDLFVAVPGVHVDGARFADQAAARGAVAVVSERPLPGLAVPVLRAPGAAEALGHLAARGAGDPSRDVAVIGVTGTNGKTTTTFLLSQVLEASGARASLLGTVANRVAGVERPSAMTTPDAIAVQQAIAETRAAGGSHLVMEVSSHALDQHRTAGVRFAAAGFTNLTRDHLDYHGTLEAYGDAKARLFEGLDPDAVCALNGRDPFAAALATRTRARVVRYGWGEAGAPDAADCAVWAAIAAEGLAGTRLELRLGGHRQAVTSPLVGRFNVENALAAAALAWGVGLAPEAVCHALERTRGVPGRLERIDGGPDAPTVLVDYAHTPDALARVTRTLRPLANAGGGQLVVVFGCGGGRDRGKRAPMARAVEETAHLAIVTSDNPRDEPPQAILAEVLAGFRRPAGVRAIEDRRAAIRAAIAAAGPRDVVLLAGKGHETTQVIAGVATPFDDREVARAELRRAA